ncbi:DUF1294 domain-containing protein [Bacillus solitudinis]|uniref:DUF1294 domain-containing protein n=1 Tax=Bacillus solitudinis TaxID=2014074 RepID=UPI000C248DAD|nr:DUF1294 domain-containing protein [Bacillus solitudinis]
MSLIGYFIMGYDKRQAKLRNYRVSERTLFMVALLGGSLGMYGGMKTFRHKTKHRNFTIGIPCIIIIQTILILLYFSF